MQRYKNLVVLLVVLLIVIAGGSVLFKKYFDGNTHERVKVSKVNLEKAEGAEKIPANFPKDIPIQLTDVEDSTSSEYPGRNVIVSSITFKTLRDPRELFNTYKQYFETNGYLINTTATKEENGVLYASKKDNTVAVIISYADEINSARRVQIVYTAHILEQ